MVRQVIDNEDGRQSRSGGLLRSLVVEVDGILCALVYVRESLLVGVLGTEANKANSRGNTSIKGASSERSSSAAGESTEESERQSLSENGSDPTDEDEGTEERSREKNMRALLLKGEALAEYLREQLKDFVMPRDME